MTFPVVGSNIPGAYQISNSLRFNDDDTARLTRTPSANGNQKTFTTSFWVKKGNLSDCTIFSFGTSPTYNISVVESGSEFFLATTQVGVTQVWSGKSEGKYRDVSAWYHVVIAIDTTQATSSNRVKAYINGNFVSNQSGFTYPSQNYNTIQNPQTTWAIGSRYDGNNPADMYLAEIHHIDGQQLDASSFGEFDEDSGVWKPKQYEGTYGTNGFYLKFNNAGNMGEDSSGNDNTWTPTNLSGTTDVTTDTPSNNFATLNALATFTSGVLSEGNLKHIGGNGTLSKGFSTQAVSNGKWYAEVKVVDGGQKSRQGVRRADYMDYNDNEGIVLDYNYIYQQGTEGGTFEAVSWSGSNHIIGVALNKDDNQVTFYVDGSQIGSVQSLANTDKEYCFFSDDYSDSNNDEPVWEWNFGNPPYTISSGNSDDNGYGNFEYAPPSGYLALCTQNLATELSPTIDDGSQYFNTVLYTGNGSTQSITGVGFQPDWLWIKSRTFTDYHGLFDSNRGSTKRLFANATDAETTQAAGVTSFDSDGFSLGSNLGQNRNSQNFVAWNWKANAGSTSSNTDGTITSTVQANTTAGFSIVTYTGNNTAGATVGHGLGVAPGMVIVKNRETSPTSWCVSHVGYPTSQNLYLDEALAVLTRDRVTARGTSTFTVGSHVEVNSSSDTYVAYCFTNIEGYSKFGSYTGNGSTDGPFVNTGFRPAFIIYKNSSSATDWRMFDNKRNSFNVIDGRLFPNIPDVENTAQDTVDFLSNGFKLRATNSGDNSSGNTFIYMAFAENPFVTSGAVPVTAR